MIGLANVLGSLLQTVYSVACRKVSRLLLCGFNFFMSLGCLLTGIANRFEVVVTGNAVAGVGSGGTPPSEAPSSAISSRRRGSAPPSPFSTA